MAVVSKSIGTPVLRREDLRFLRGRGEFVDDVAEPNALRAAILRSPLAHGRLKSVDARAARALPGVHAVITAAEIGQVPTIPLRLQPMPETELFKQPVIAFERVRYVGEPVAVVVADTAAIAEDALDAIQLDIEPLPVVADWRAAERPAAILPPGATSNLAARFTGVKGDADAAFRDAPYRRRERFETQRHTALPMEPRGLLAEWDAGKNRLTLKGAAKVPFFNRSALAGMFKLPEANLLLIENDVGGGFGARGEFYPEDFLIPFAARHLGRAVRWTEDRREHLSAMNHARQSECEIEIACAKDGTVIGIRGDTWVDLGAYVRTNGLTQPRNLAQFMSGPYRIPNIRVSCSAYVTNKTPCGTYRAPGRFEGAFVMERLLDMAARDLGIDPVEMRRRNLVAEAEIPYPLATIEPADAYGDTSLDSGDYRITLERCLKEFDYAEKAKLQGKLIDGRRHGVAIGCFIEGGGAGPRESTRLVLERDGAISVYSGGSAIGQGLETSMAQIAADAMELPLERIRGVYHGSTDLVREGFGSFHSRVTVLGGSATLLAADKLKEQMRAAAARRLNCSAAEIALDPDGAAGPGGRRVAIADIAAENLSAEESFTNHHHTYVYGAAAAHLTVDPRTGGIQLLDYMVVEDVGRIINPLTLHGQVIGSLVQGLGSVFLEHLIYDREGQLLTGTLADYLVPTASDFPNLRAITLEDRPCPNNPLGVKGAGEGGIIAVGGVIANALANALVYLGVEPKVLPLSPARVWDLVVEAQANGTRRG